MGRGCWIKTLRFVHLSACLVAGSLFVPGARRRYELYSYEHTEMPCPLRVLRYPSGGRLGGYCAICPPAGNVRKCGLR